jgi:predicted DNA repair protein MutK|tara:strand:+ start:69 stop:947 length:879 start_codon:yes stop_codon:yes gene_type:complete
MSGFFALLDDIAALMDDVAMMTKVATKKTAGILGDDLAVGAEKASSFRASRELPVIWAITKGSFINKLIILPFVFLLSAFSPQFIVPILLIGGIYLSFEGVEKIIYTFFQKEHRAVDFNEIETEEALLILEKSKIKSAIITDFILSLEIIMIALGTVTNYSLLIQVAVVSLVSIIATIGVYGIVALMVRIDDIGFRLIKISENKKGLVKTIFYKTGTGLVWVLPKLIKLIAIIGTLAMLLVGGGLFVHNIPSIHDFFHFLPNIISELIVGLTVGFIAYLLWKGLMIITQWKS